MFRPCSQSVVSRILRTAFFNAKDALHHEIILHFLQECSFAPGFTDPEKTLSLDLVYARMNSGHLAACPSPGADLYDRFLRLREACIASIGFMVATMKTDLAAILVKLTEEQVPWGIIPLPLEETNLCSVRPPLCHGVPPPTSTSLGPGGEVVQHNSLEGGVVPTCSRIIPDRFFTVSEELNSSFLATSPVRALKRSATVSFASTSTQTDEDPSRVMEAPSLAGLHRTALALVKNRILRHSRSVYRHHFPQLEQKEGSTSASHVSVPVQGSPTAGPRTVKGTIVGQKSVPLRAVFGKSFDRVSCPKLVSVLMLSDKDFHGRLQRSTSYPKLGAKLHSGTASTDVNRETVEAGWLTGENLLFFNLKSAQVAGAAVPSVPV